MSLLRAEGHPNAGHYPLGFMWNEVAFARQRRHASIRTDAIVMHTVIAQVMAGGEHLKNLLEGLDDG